MIKTTVEGTNDAKKALEDLVAQFDVPGVTVGIHEGTAKPSEGQINMATLGAIQHFGNDKIPARPWLDAGFDSGIQEYLAILEAAFESEEDLEAAMNQVGVVAVGKVQEFITQLKSPPNVPSTVKRKKSANPLIDTGAMRSSVSYQLQQEKPEEGL